MKRIDDNEHLISKKFDDKIVIFQRTKAFSTPEKSDVNKIQEKMRNGVYNPIYVDSEGYINGKDANVFNFIENACKCSDDGHIYGKFIIDEDGLESKQWIKSFGVQHFKDTQDHPSEWVSSYAHKVVFFVRLSINRNEQNNPTGKINVTAFHQYGMWNGSDGSMLFDDQDVIDFILLKAFKYIEISTENYAKEGVILYLLDGNGNRR